VNVLRLGLHPQGLAPRIQNYQQWRTHILTRLRHQIDATADPVLVELLAELEAYPRPTVSNPSQEHADETDYGGVVVPMRVLTEYGPLSFFGTTTVFGTPLDITLAELAIESFFPADRETADLLAQAARSNRGKTDGQA
jgi:MmyB-like transcription regulator ligand binding domain